MGPRTFVEQGLARLNGSKFWEYMGVLDNSQKKALLWAEIQNYPDDTERELETYNFYINSDRHLLPFSGGYLEQPAWVIEALERIDAKMALVRRMDEIDRKVDEARNKQNG